VTTRRTALQALAAAALSACGRGSDGDAERAPRGPLRVVLKHQPFGGDPAVLRSVMARFEQQHPGVVVVAETLPSSSDVVHQFFLTSLEGGARDFDVLIADVVWTAELARAGWIADISSAFPPATMRGVFLPAAAESAMFQGKTFAVPWYLDVGLLYRRTDLCPIAPRTYDELAERAHAGLSGGRVEQGYVWQGRQYEGLVCNAYESIWGHGGATMTDGRLALDTPEARAGVTWMRTLIERGLSPAAVTSMAEEESRHVFQEGRAMFMRNWPYAFTEAQKSGSPIQGKVAISALPTVSGEPGSGTLGGWQLALNARTPSYKREAALALMKHLTSEDTNITLAIAYGRNPPRRSAYTAPRMIAGAPFVASLLPMLERARSRPHTPYYSAIADTLQSELSAAITRVRSPAEALRRAETITTHIMRGSP
jgi:multiple sugar transport system substrate-binding protein